LRELITEGTSILPIHVISCVPELFWPGLIANLKNLVETEKAKKTKKENK
jgi:hypothetical protein